MTRISQLHKWRRCCRIQQIGILVALVCAFVILAVKGADVTDVIDESGILLDFKSSISDERGVLGGWNAEEAPYYCEWRGISCDKNFHISSINLRDSHLSGTISPELYRLRKLRILILSENNFFGTIPSQLAQIKSLWKLKLDHNNLSGSIPGQLGHLSNLRIMDLSYNGLSGLIPETIFRNCRRLRFVSFAQNMLNGSLPVSLSNCVKLTAFDFSSNALQGNITVDLSELRDLNYVDLQRNSFSGHIPKVFGSLQALHYIHLGNNFLSGSLPQELKDLSGLKQLSLNNNLLSGEVPADLMSLPSLWHLDLSGNSFTERFHLNASGCTSLRSLNLAGNMLEGGIPLALSNCSHLMFLILANNRLNGSLPTEIGRLAQLKSLDASGNQLDGEIPATIAGLASLSALVLRSNRIEGKIPLEFGNLKALEILDLSNMRLDGSIPSELGGCTALQKLDLSRNELDGGIPGNLDELTGLKELDLESNRLTGGIPAALGNLTELAIFNVSYNHLSGKVPREKALAQFGFMSFLGNPDLCGAPWTISCQEVVSPAPTRTPTSPVPPNTAKDKQRRPVLTKTGIFAVSIIAAFAMAVFIISLFSVLIWRKKKRTKRGINEEEHINGLSNLETPVGKLVLLNGVHPSSYDDCVEKGIGTLLNNDDIVGRGSIGTVYRVTISGGITIAVKKLRTLERLRDAEAFEADMLSLDNLQHRNLVMLQGYYLSRTLKLILSEFVPNGTLSDHLHRNPSAMSLTWLQRYTIGLGIARGLVQLHCNHCPPIMHFNLTSKNVILDESFEAKISDYGLRKFLPIQNKYISSRLYHETIAYVAPELACGSLRVSEKCDVYSFGVVLLELVTGRKPSQEINGATVLLGDFVRSKLDQESIGECIDPTLSGYDGLDVVDVIKLAVLCTSQEPSSRPTMAEALRILESIEGGASSASRLEGEASSASPQQQIRQQSSHSSFHHWREQ
ncbi:hypothetical protein M758_9G140500 [Ceratodon purpureus]|nr:hypothetical protein M758_9G140500 [Ceratodon purpureus]